MENYTLAQAGMAYGAMRQERFDAAEEQSRLVWAVANGWKRPVSVDEASEKLKKMGVLSDG